MTYRHIDGVEVTAQFSDDRKFRYRLDISMPNFSPAHETACVVMQNPSYASERVADKSVQFMEKNVFLRGLPEFAAVRRLVVVNQFARIQTNHFQGMSHEIGSQNDSVIKAVLKESDIIIIGWGCANRFEKRKNFFLACLRKLKNKRLFQTRKHPSRGCYKDFIQPFNLVAP